jgi:hypothetical protein
VVNCAVLVITAFEPIRIPISAASGAPGVAMTDFQGGGPLLLGGECMRLIGCLDRCESP